MSLLGANGYITQQQRRLESISLVTDPCCKTNQKGNNRLDLSHFQHLLELSWIGLHSNDDMIALEACLRENSQHLRSLTLSSIGWRMAGCCSRHVDQNNGCPARDFFASYVLGICEGSEPVVFSALRSLCLSSLSFKGAFNKWSSALKVENLRELKLWDCRGTLHLLNRLVDTKQAINLISLEIVVLGFSQNTNSPSLHNFLQTFTGLEALYLILPFSDWDLTIKGVMRHRETLRRLVLHSRILDHYGMARDGLVYGSHPTDGNHHRDSKLFNDSCVPTDCDFLGISNPSAITVSSGTIPVSQGRANDSFLSLYNCNRSHGT